MWRICGRFWPFILLLLAGVGIVYFRFAVERRGQTPPNYTLIEEGLYMGGHVEAPPAGTGAVLNLSQAKDGYSAAVYEWAAIADSAPAPSVAWLRKQVEFIDAQRRAGATVFVHCDAGISRSGLVMVAYFMWRNHWSREAALAFVRSKRAEVNPNPAFMGLLAEWEMVCAGM